MKFFIFGVFFDPPTCKNPPFCYKTLFEKNFLQKIMNSNLQNIVTKWADEETPELKDITPVVVTPDFDTPLAQSYPRKEKQIGAKEGVRVAANTAAVLKELGMQEEETDGSSETDEGQDRVDMFDATDIFEKTFGVTSSEMGEAQAACSRNAKNPQGRPAKPEEMSISPARLYNTYTASKLATIMTEYDHQVVEDAAQMRTYVTNKLLEISSCGDSKQELRALELLGKISDVGLFSEKTEINVTHTTESLEHSIKDKINRLMGQIHDAEFEEVPTLEIIEEESDGSEEGFETS